MLDELTRVSSYAQILQHLFSVRVKKVLEEVSDRLIGDVSANHDVPAKKYLVTCNFRIFHNNLTMSVLHARSGVVLTLIYRKNKTWPI